MKTRKYIYWLLALLCYLPAFTQSPVKIQRLEAGEKTCLHEGWFARKASEIGEDGNRLTGQPFEATGWMKAKVPGTVLTTLLENKLYPAPEFGLNNQLIPDIFHVGRAFYTYWFACPFTMEALLPGQHVWLNFRGINYKAEIYLNGKRVNTVIRMADKVATDRLPAIVPCNIRRAGIGFSRYETAIRVFGMKFPWLLLKMSGYSIRMW